MRKLLARHLLTSFRRRYAYDTSYLDYILDNAPAAFFKFARIGKLTNHREAVPPEAYFAAKLIGALAEDCGPCAQLVIDMAREAGVPDPQIEAVLNRAPARMSDAVVLAFRFADAVVRRSDAAEEARDAVRAHWGDKGVIDLTLALQIGRMFPMLKAGLGFARECRRVTVGQHHVDVVQQAA
jgi:alkylhydroperoxidase family enzyme